MQRLQRPVSTNAPLGRIRRPSKPRICDPSLNVLPNYVVGV